MWKDAHILSQQRNTKLNNKEVIVKLLEWPTFRTSTRPDAAEDWQELSFIAGEKAKRRILLVTQ